MENIPTCAVCHKPIEDTYYEVNGQKICPMCDSYSIGDLHGIDANLVPLGEIEIMEAQGETVSEEN